MKRLYLLRHAKAQAAHAGQDDRDRPLAGRGMGDAAALARYLAGAALPQWLLVSPAARTLQTAALLVPAMNPPPRVEARETLYLASPGTILAEIATVPAAVNGLMVVGHNPGLEELAAFLARDQVTRAEHARRDALEEKFPTCALAVLDFAVTRWRALMPGEGRLADFVRPRDM